jgi:hypothetical protein
VALQIVLTRASEDWYTWIQPEQDATNHLIRDGGANHVLRGDVHVAERALELTARIHRATSPCLVLATRARKQWVWPDKASSRHFDWRGTRSRSRTGSGTNPRWVFLDLLAFIVVAQAQVERAGCLFGAAEAVLEGIHLDRNLFVHNDLGPFHDRAVAAMRSGPEAQRFLAAWALGRQQLLNEAVAYALADEGPELAPVTNAQIAAAAAGDQGDQTNASLN